MVVPVITDPVQREKVFSARAILVGCETQLQMAASRLNGVEFSEASGDVSARLARILAGVRESQKDLMMLVTIWEEEGR